MAVIHPSCRPVPRNEPNIIQLPPVVLGCNVEREEGVIFLVDDPPSFNLVRAVGILQSPSALLEDVDSDSVVAF